MPRHRTRIVCCLVSSSPPHYPLPPPPSPTHTGMGYALEDMELVAATSNKREQRALVLTEARPARPLRPDRRVDRLLARRVRTDSIRQRRGGRDGRVEQGLMAIAPVKEVVADEITGQCVRICVRGRLGRRHLARFNQLSITQLLFNGSPSLSLFSSLPFSLHQSPPPSLQ